MGHSTSLAALASLTMFASITVQAVGDKRAKHKIALLHMYDDVEFFQELGSVTGANKERYAARHGYEMVVHTPAKTTGLYKEVPCYKAVKFDRAADGKCYKENQSFTIDKRAATFGKIKLALAACVARQNYWLLWSDADALVVNHATALQDLIDDSKDIMLTSDWLMINAGVILLKCSDWNIEFMTRVYEDRKFDKARALDQSAFDHYFTKDPTAKSRLKHVPKHLLNVYPEEYIPGDFLVHCAGKLFEATSPGAVALARQLDAFSMAEDLADIEAFFSTPYLLNAYSGTCVGETENLSETCSPEDPRRTKLDRPLKDMARPNRYRHVGERYHWLVEWKDEYDVEGWNDDRVAPKPISSDPAGRKDEDDHEEL